MDRPIPRWLRAFFLVVTVQAFLVTPALFQPSLINIVEPWPASPLNARFIGALYTALGIGVLLCLGARAFREVRLILIGIGVATGVLLVISLARLQAFGLGELALHQFPTMWILFYIIDPLVVVYTLWRFRDSDPAGGGRSDLWPLWTAEAALLGLVALVLLVAPPLAMRLWPWALTEPLSQLYSGHFLTLAFVCALAAREARWEGVRIVAVTLVVLSLLVLVVSVIHLDRFKPNASTIVWFALFGAEAVGLGLLLWRRGLRRAPSAPEPRATLP